MRICVPYTVYIFIYSKKYTHTYILYAYHIIHVYIYIDIFYIRRNMNTHGMISQIFARISRFVLRAKAGFGTTFAYIQTGLFGHAMAGTTLSMSKKGSMAHCWGPLLVFSKHGDA